MATSYPVARVNLDRAGGLIVTGAATVFVNGDEAKWLAAVEGSTIGSPPNPGDVIVNSNTSVFVENRKIAIEGAVTAQGYTVGRSSPNVFAGNG
jgi:uncharacterized Zn-binding protein involved in type VI secretion